MALMPRGEPRSVRDPDGDAYDEMIRQERLKRDRAQGRKPLPLPWAASVFSPFVRQFSPEDFRKPLVPTVTIGDRTYREIDNGRANVLVPFDPLTPEERARRRQDVERIMYMAGNPLAGASYGIAAAAGASPQTQDAALRVGGAADALMLGAALRGLQTPRRAPPYRTATAGPSLGRDPTRYGRLNEKGQAPGATATITKSMLGTGTKPDRRLRPPGWSGNGKKFNEARGHVLGRQLGGDGGIPEGLVTLTQRGANSPQMRAFENRVAKRVRGGEVVEYSSTPLYGEEALPPAYMLVTAHGVKGGPAARLIRNPAGHPKRAAGPSNSGAFR